MLAGFAVISHWVPFLLFSVYAGALADRFDCRKLIQISQGLFALASFAWAVLFLTGTVRIWHAAAILLIHGAAGVIGLPASQLLVYDIVGPERLPSAIRLNATSRYLAILLGPAVGGGLMLLLAPATGCSRTSSSTRRSRSTCSGCRTRVTGATPRDGARCASGSPRSDGSWPRRAPTPACSR